MTNENESKQYSKGYQAGLKKRQSISDKEVSDLKSKLLRLENERQERVYIQCLDMVLRNCSGWTISGRKVDNAESYCRLAKFFADHSIKILSE